MPENTADLLRSIHVALYALRDGPAVIGTPLVDLDPGLQALSWAHRGYSYPPLALPLFVLIAAISPTLFFAKLALTTVEALNATLVARITGRPWLGVAYWGLPGSIWWASREGQFEPLMALCMLGAVALIGRGRPVAAGAALGLGVNVKLTAIVLAPWLLHEIRKRYRASLGTGTAALAAALLIPVAVASLWYPVAEGVVGIPGTVRYNPYYWNPFDPTIFRWNPGWLRAADALASYGMLAFLVGLGITGRVRWPQLVGAIAFLALVKTSSLGQFWYFVLFPALVMPVDGRLAGVDLRWWLVALTPLLDVRSLGEVVFGPFGWSEAAVYEGLSAFSRFGIR